jgi:hypothetical protein
MNESVQALVAAVEADRSGKYDRTIQNKEADLAFETDQSAGTTLFHLAPRSLLKQERLYFTPFSWTQYCNRVLCYPPKALDLSLITPQLVVEIANERRKRIRNRILKFRLRGDPEFVRTSGASGRIYLRGFVDPSFPYFPMADVLEKLATAAGPHELELRSRPVLPDHFYMGRFTILDPIEIGGRRFSLGFYLGHSEVGAIRSGLRLDRILYEEGSKAALVLRYNQAPLFSVTRDHKDLETLGEALSDSVAKLVDCSDWATKLLTVTSGSPGTIIGTAETGMRQICQAFNVELAVRTKAITTLRALRRPVGVSRLDVALAIADAAKEEKPEKRLSLEILAGNILQEGR